MFFFQTGANKSGTEKLDIWVVGISMRPRAFRGVNIPVVYRSQANAWMTKEIFTELMKAQDRKFRLQGRKVVFFMDSVSVHPIEELNEVLRNIHIEPLPVNSSAETQPMDLGIIKNIKYHYRKELVLERLACLEAVPPQPLEWSILDAVMTLKSAWTKVKKETISNSWRTMSLPIAVFLGLIIVTELVAHWSHLP